MRHHTLALDNWLIRDRGLDSKSQHAYPVGYTFQVLLLNTSSGREYKSLCSDMQFFENGLPCSPARTLCPVEARLSWQQRGRLLSTTVVHPPTIRMPCTTAVYFAHVSNSYRRWSVCVPWRFNPSNWHPALWFALVSQPPRSLQGASKSPCCLMTRFRNLLLYLEPCFRRKSSQLSCQASLVGRFRPVQFFVSNSKSSFNPGP